MAADNVISIGGMLKIKVMFIDVIIKQETQSYILPVILKAFYMELKLSLPYSKICEENYFISRMLPHAMRYGEHCMF